MKLSYAAEQSLKISLALNKGDCGGSYLESTLLMSSLLSALASHCWPGKARDRTRFIELWARYGSSDASLVSVPLLSQWLRYQTRTAEAESLESLRHDCFGPGNSSKILTGPDVDLPEQEVTKVCPSLDVADVRKHTYPALFYMHVRSSLAHEYAIRGSASAWTMTTTTAGISYMNLAVPGSGTKREIYYAADWLADLIRDVATNVDRLSIPLSTPATWWIEGGS